MQGRRDARTRPQIWRAKRQRITTDSHHRSPAPSLEPDRSRAARRPERSPAQAARSPVRQPSLPAGPKQAAGQSEAEGWPGDNLPPPSWSKSGNPPPWSASGNPHPSVRCPLVRLRGDRAAQAQPMPAASAGLQAEGLAIPPVQCRPAQPARRQGGGVRPRGTDRASCPSRV